MAANRIGARESIGYRTRRGRVGNPSEWARCCNQFIVKKELGRCQLGIVVGSWFDRTGELALEKS